MTEPVSCPWEHLGYILGQTIAIVRNKSRPFSARSAVLVKEQKGSQCFANLPPILKTGVRKDLGVRIRRPPLQLHR
jgi:hypothetical protein